MGKVATKKALLDRGINLSDALCANCGFEEESADHLFAKCLTARSVWWNIFSWLKVPWPSNVDSLKDLLEVFYNSPGSKVWKRLAHMVAVDTVWRIWNARNRKVFEGDGISVRKIVDSIKEESFIWVSNRSNKTAPSWDDWKVFDVLSLL
ncbi:uncharacterized protein LOC110893235 [Helianthus annuus]|uniref:uncharacterized protein LOC110893235 n=1 Tax=Helianthus annuus TaxID=4232 RepID=UPI000B906299|nr:uncharacterized protein LOC110893235 [Helianthus annuus]